MKIFGEKLRELRTDRGLTQLAFSKELGVSSGVISMWENGLSEPLASAVVKVAKYFGVTTDYLLGLED